MHLPEAFVLLQLCHVSNCSMSACSSVPRRGSATRTISCATHQRTTKHLSTALSPEVLSPGGIGVEELLRWLLPILLGIGWGSGRTVDLPGGWSREILWNECWGNSRKAWLVSLRVSNTLAFAPVCPQEGALLVCAKITLVVNTFNLVISLIIVYTVVVLSLA